jgi:pimeloyl-ACP methyl ester carboxylesterase
VQGSVSGATFAEPLTRVPAWRQVPTWFQVSALDRVVHPDLQRFFAARMNAKTTTLSTGHASPVSRPRQIAALIQRAAIAVC